jgi:hypothetical protein
LSATSKMGSTQERRKKCAIDGLDSLGGCWSAAGKSASLQYWILAP